MEDTNLLNIWENDARLRELSSKAVDGNITDEELAEMVQLSRAKQKLREGRAAAIADLREAVRSQGFTIADLFSKEEIVAAAPLSDSAGLRVKRVKPVRTPRTGQTWLRQKSGLVLIQVSKEGAGGFPCRYCKGQLLPYYVAKGWKALDDGQLEANLERHFTAQGREYFATDAGRAELAQLVHYIRTHSVKTQAR